MAPQPPYSIEDILEAKETLAPLFPLELLATAPLKIDLSKNNAALKSVSLAELDAHIAKLLKETQSSWTYGGWGEERRPYQSNSSGQSVFSHSLHLGVDIWLPVGTPLFSPIAGTIHSFQEDAPFLGYGPTIITEHSIGAANFFILYGHLSRESLKGLKMGKRIRLGDQIATIGDANENGSWPSHLHLQIIPDTGNKAEDFQNNVKTSDKDMYMSLYPNPESLFRSFIPV